MNNFKTKILEKIVKSRTCFASTSDGLTIQWCSVTFLQNFGPWKKGQKCYDLTFNLTTLILTETNQDEYIVDTYQITMT